MPLSSAVYKIKRLKEINKNINKDYRYFYFLFIYKMDNDLTILPIKESGDEKKT